MTRLETLDQLNRQNAFDMVVVGGGATGLGVALDAVTRGLKVALFESHDFGSGTSSKATKLVHGGVRYLAQGHIPLVYEALHERSRLLANAPHNAHAMPFVVPSYHWWEKPFYGIGLKLYDWLAGAQGLGHTEFLSANQTLQALPGIKPTHLTGGVRYMDGQFNDARLAVDLARTAASFGALMLNHCAVQQILQDDSQVCGVQVRDAETGREFKIQSRCVINATGVWVDGLRNAKQALVRPSRGVHVVVSGDFLPGETALMIPKTRDGRVLFVVPWLGHVILGTTDTPVDDIAYEPQAQSADLDFILNEAAHYLTRAPKRSDILSIWAGLRPLVQDTKAGSTKQISREHTIEVATSGLVTVTGGKWTTYRAMAEDVLRHAIDAGLLSTSVPKDSVTKNLSVLGANSPCNTASIDAVASADFIRFAVEHEFARNVEDVLARRSRALFLDAKRAAELAPHVAQTMLGMGLPKVDLQIFQALAKQYQACP
jgi:glycerol-3-phosphate dehydrogenase